MLGLLSNTNSSFEGEVYEVMVASKSLNDFAIRRLKDISLTNGEVREILQALILSKPTVPCLVEPRPYIRKRTRDSWYANQHGHQSAGDVDS